MSGGKRKLLVILGAGTSLSCGMPSTGEIDNLMQAWSSRWSNLPTFPIGSVGRGVFGDLWDMVSAYQRQNPQPQLGLRLNYEKILGEMVALASWTTPSPFGNALRNTVQDPRLSSAFTWPQGHEEPYFYRHLIIEQLGFLVGCLANHMRQRCRDLDVTSNAFGDYAEILQRLAEAFDVGIYNLNYDDLAVRALPQAFTGFSGGKFDAQAVADRTSWNFIYHLHGSVHYSLSGSSLRPNILWKDDLAGEFEDSQPLMPSMAAEFRPVIPTTLVAGGFKLDQLLAEPAQSFFASLVRHAQQADAFLIAGYGFADVHVNRALQNRFAVDANGPRGRPQTIVATKTDPPFGLIGDREGHEFFAWELTHTLSTRFSSSGATPGLRFSISELIDRGVFESDPFGRARIWHGGFSQARDHLDQLVRSLQHP
jgi:hypothetical protein